MKLFRKAKKGVIEATDDVGSRNITTVVAENY